MFAEHTFETILQRLLARVSNEFDKREGSIIYDATAPASWEMAILYAALDFILNETFADTASREHLIRRAAEYGVVPMPATYAHLLAYLDGVSVPVGHRFSLENTDLDYEVIARQPDYDTPEHTAYEVRCETVGAIGHQMMSGRLVPIVFLPGLTNAQLAGMLIPGQDEEDTERFRQRYFDSFRNRDFGGNRADYINRVTALQGVGAVKVYPVWNHEMAPEKLIPNFDPALIEQVPSEMRPWLDYIHQCASNLWLTVGGTVRLVLLNVFEGIDDPRYLIPTEHLVKDVQQAIDPPENEDGEFGHGEGLGIAPIGHIVNVFPADTREFTIEFVPTVRGGASTENMEWLQTEVTTRINAYFISLARDWGMTNSDIFATTSLTVRWAQVMNTLMEIPEIIDVQNLVVTAYPSTGVNADCCDCIYCDGPDRGNIQLGPDEIPVLREVIIHESA